MHPFIQPKWALAIGPVGETQLQKGPAQIGKSVGKEF